MNSFMQYVEAYLGIYCLKVILPPNSTIDSSIGTIILGFCRFLFCLVKHSTNDCILYKLSLNKCFIVYHSYWTSVIYFSFACFFELCRSISIELKMNVSWLFFCLRWCLRHIALKTLMISSVVGFLCRNLLRKCYFRIETLG